MAAEVLAAGARSIYLDVEPHAGVWRGTPAAAAEYGRELRRLQPNAQVVLSLDPRPWTFERLPMSQFVEFSDLIAPQQYWRTFNTPPNYERFAQTGFPVGPEGVTPEHLLNVSNQTLGTLGRPLVQVGQGATPDSNEWRRFIDGAYNSGGQYVTVWRYGVTEADVFQMLQDIPPKRPVVATAASGGGVYVVQAGDTLFGIAGRFDVSMDAIMQANGLSDPNYIYEGQELIIPGLMATAATSASASTATATATGSGQSYTVQSGDTLSGIAGQFGKSWEELASANGLSDPHALSVGQELKIP
jgi:LysM repeat protein